MIRRMEVLWQRRLALAVALPVFLICAPFIAVGAGLMDAVQALWAVVPKVVRNSKDMWSKDFKVCKRM